MPKKMPLDGATIGVRDGGGQGGSVTAVNGKKTEFRVCYCS